MSRPPNRPARRFAVRAALVLLAIGVTVHALVVRTVDAELQQQLAQRGEFVTDHLLAPALQAGTDPDAAAAAVVGDVSEIEGVTIRDDRAAVVGRAGTTRDIDVASCLGAQCLSIPGTDGWLAVLYQDASVVTAAATDVTRRLALVVGVGLLALWLAIVPLAYRLGRELRGQADELREQSRELERLLGREQLTVRRLREVDEMRDRFLESISHELRTPLTVVKGSLQMLATKGDDLPPHLRADLTARAHEKAERLSALVQALLDLNASAEAPQDVRWVDVRAATEAARRALPPRAVEYDLDVEGIVTGRTLLVRTLGALLGNAVRHAPGDDPIVVRARRHGDDVELQVDDRGRGIPEELREEVFAPFRQGPLLDAHSPGTGIGLALVAAHAAQHNGRAWASERPGGGTRIHLLLPDVVGEPPADRGEDAFDDVARSVVTPVVADPARGPRQEPTPPAPERSNADEDAEPAPAPTRRVVRRRVVRRSSPGREED